jgi:flagellar basal body-associated protein FliL
LKGSGRKDIVKYIRAVSVITLIVMVLSVSLVSVVSALEQNQASVTTFMSEEPKVRGEQTSIRVLFTSKSDKDLSVYYVGIHLDWMDEDQLYGIDYSGSPKTVASMKDLVVDIINYTVPTSASPGTHKYYIGVDGYDEDGNAFSWKSDESSIIVSTAASTNQPTPTQTETNQNPPSMNTSFVIYGVLIAVAVAIIVIVFVLKKRGANSPAKPSEDKPESPKPEKKPDGSLDFDI